MTGTGARFLHGLAPFAAISRRLSTWVAWYTAQACRQAQRRSLARLDDHLLRDIGVSRGEAEREANRRFWE